MIFKHNTKNSKPKSKENMRMEMEDVLCAHCEKQEEGICSSIYQKSTCRTLEDFNIWFNEQGELA